MCKYCKVFSLHFLRTFPVLTKWAPNHLYWNGYQMLDMYGLQFLGSSLLLYFSYPHFLVWRLRTLLPSSPHFEIPMYNITLLNIIIKSDELVTEIITVEIKGTNIAVMYGSWTYYATHFVGIILLSLSKNFCTWESDSKIHYTTLIPFIMLSTMGCFSTGVFGSDEEATKLNADVIWNCSKKTFLSSTKILILGALFN